MGVTTMREWRWVGLIWVAFFVVSLSPLVVGSFLRDSGFGDVFLYHRWVREGVERGMWPVIDVPWVYPIGALAPMALLAPFAGGPHYVTAWWALVLVLNAVTLIVIRDFLKNGLRAAWWWLAFLFLLGATGLSRIDSIATGLATIALVLVSRHPRAAATLVTAAGWIKLAHFTWLLPLYLVATGRTKNVLVPAAIVFAVVMSFAVSLGSGARIFGFLTEQSDRGLQTESVFATPFSVARILDGTPRPELRRPLQTMEFPGTSADAVAKLLDPLLVVAVLGISIMVWLAHRRARLSPIELIAVSTFAMTLVLIVFNKVGSPQFTLWLAAPLVLSFSIFSDEPVLKWRTPLTISLVVAALTQIVYPLFYFDFIRGTTPLILASALRNALIVVLLVWAVRALVEAAQRPSRASVASDMPGVHPERNNA
jgi:hypothetical protein